MTKRGGWLTGLIAGLFALTVLAAPAQHAGAVLRKIADVHATHAQHLQAYADPGAPDGGHHEHPLRPDCFACVIVAAPGLPASPFVQPSRIPLAVAADPGERTVAPAHEVAWSPWRARAPPLGPS